LPKPLENGPKAALLSYLVPGLGQIYQGRLGKGILFFVCIYTLFFYGQWQGTGTVRLGDHDYAVTSNVYLPHTAHLSNPWSLWEPLADLYNRPHFLGQFWVGFTAWPALWQYSAYNPAQDDDPPLRGFQRQPSERVLQELQRSGDKTWDLAWVFTVIAGVLNIMVIYDAFAGPAFVLNPAADPQTVRQGDKETRRQGDRGQEPAEKPLSPSGGGPLICLSLFPCILVLLSGFSFAQVNTGHLPYYWHLPILLVIISLVYSATRFDDWGLILREAVRWGIRLFFFLLVIAVILFVLASVI
jgi:hypothetical protein